MPKIVIGLEAGANANQIYDAWIIGEMLTGRGHEVCYIVPDPIGFAELGGPDTRLDIYPAPKLPDRPPLVMKPPRVGGVSDRLALQGYGEAASLRFLADIWARQLQFVRPDVIVSMSAPVLWLVGPKIAPTLVIGDGASLPPVVNKTLPRLVPEIAPIMTAAEMIENVNYALASLGQKAVANLGELLGRCTVHHYGLNIFDPYLTLRREPTLGVLGRVKAAARPSPKLRMAMFLDTQCPNIEAILVALNGVDHMAIDLFLKGATPAMRNYLGAVPGLILWDDFNAARWQAGGASAIVHHGVPLVAADALALGKPQLLLPWNAGHQAVLEGLQTLGMSWDKDPSVDIHELSGALRALPNASGMQIKVQHFSRELAGVDMPDALEGIAALVENISSPAAPPKAAQSTSYIGEVFPVTGDAPPQTSDAAARETPATAAQVDSFCAMPFQHLCVGYEGTARICCMSTALISKDEAPMSLYLDSLDSIWNSQTLRGVRRKMLNGEAVAECEVCYADERATGISYRTMVGRQPIPEQPLDVASLNASLAAKDYRVDEPPGFFKLELGNLCNLKCRMCFGSISSEIERDPVHSRWSGAEEPLHAIWDKDWATIGPHPRLGVRRAGVHAPRTDRGESFCWTGTSAAFDIPLAIDTRLASFDFGFDPQAGQGLAFVIKINGKTHLQAVVDQANPQYSIDLAALPLKGALTIEIEAASGGRSNGAGGAGLPVAWMKLHRQGDAASADIKSVLRPRLAKPGVWYQSDELIFGELLARVDTLKRLYLTGGEPLLEPRVPEILDFIIDRGLAPGIALEFTTNATVIDQGLLDRIAKFKSVLVTISVDGVGAVQEYIRYPARWAVIEKNIRTMRGHGLTMAACPVVQSYNMLHLAEIGAFCADVGIDVNFANILRVPQFVGISVMPANAHREAAARFRRFAEAQTNPDQRTHCLALVKHFESFDQPLDPVALRQFMLFTNDLDISRGQSFRDSLPDLFGLIEQAGFRWTDETLHGKIAAKRVAARDRVHAWI